MLMNRTKFRYLWVCVLVLTFWIWFNIRSTVSELAVESIRKDGELQGLVNLLNSRPDVFKGWEYHDDANYLRRYAKFMMTLTPWIIAPPAGNTTSVPLHNPLYIVNCSCDKYKYTLSGKQLSSPRVIVDFIPFGYDVDKLEIRLHENFFAVDAFVIFESPLTQTGLRKPMIYHLIKHTPRFLKYQEKVIYITATAAEMMSLVDGWKFDAKDFRLENAMRIMMLRKFREISSAHAQYVLFRRIVESIWPFVASDAATGRGQRQLDRRYMANSTRLLSEAPLAIQADGDEIPTGSALLHLKYCQLKHTTFPVYLPDYSYKHNIHTLQKETYVHLLTDPADTSNVFLDYLNDVGPMVDTLYSFVRANSTQRVRRLQLDVHLGVGAALHLSSVLEPAEVWAKAGSTHHGLENKDLWRVMSHEFIMKGRRSVLTVEDILAVTHIHSSSMTRISRGKMYICTERNRQFRGDERLRPISSFDKVRQKMLTAHLPWALRNHPELYPFIVPPYCA